MNNCSYLKSRNTNSAPKNRLPTHKPAFSHYSHYLGSIIVDPENGTCYWGIKEQAKQCLSNIKSIVESIMY